MIVRPSNRGLTRSLSFGPSGRRFPEGGIVFLDDTVSSVCGQIDATLIASIPSSSPVSQTFANVIESPADGSGQTDNDFFNGLDITPSTDDMGFSGTPGSNSAFLTTDGAGDLSILKEVSSAVTLKDWHRTDVSGSWIAIVFRYDDTGSSQTFFGNVLPGLKGVAIRVNTVDFVGIQQGNGSAFALNNSTVFLTDGSDNLLIVSWDGTSTTNNVKFWLNSDTVTETLSVTFKTSTTSTAQEPSAAAQANGFDFMGADSRIYGWSWGNVFLDDTEATKIRAWYNQNHAQSY